MKPNVQDEPGLPDDLASKLQGAAPPLSTEALARVELRMWDEFDRGERRTRIRRVVLGFGMAASVLLAICGYTYFRMSGETNAPAPMVRTIERSAPAIEERITIAVSTASPSVDQNAPLVRLDEFRSLFTD